MENREPEKSNPNHRRVFYFLNILFMCVITVASLTMAVILFVRLERLRSERQTEGTIYTDSQIEKIRYGAAQSERNRILLEIQSSFESGNSTISMLRDLFPGDLVVMWEGRYYFYPVDRNLQMNPFSATDFKLVENGGMEYIGENPSVKVNRGIDVSSLNGEIEWDKVSEDRIAFAMIRAAVRNSSGELEQDELFEENMREAKSVGIRTGCYVDLDAARIIANAICSSATLGQSISPLSEETSMPLFTVTPVSSPIYSMAPFSPRAKSISENGFTCRFLSTG